MISMFDFLKKNKVNLKKEADTSEKDESESNVEIGTGISINTSVRQSTSEANIKYYKPKYSPKTRKRYYDDSNARKSVANKTFNNNNNKVRDPYTGSELLRNKSEAKKKYGEDWQKHCAEADHIDPLNKFIERHQDNPFLTTSDIKQIGNSEDNLQVISRKLNQNSNAIGKGGSTQLEWASNSKKMKNLEKNIESRESIKRVTKKIKKIGKKAERRNDSKAYKKGLHNAFETAHDAGKTASKNAGVTALTMSGIFNLVSVIKGEKSGKDALVDVVYDGGKAAITGYALGGGLTVLSHTLSCSSSQFIQGLVSSNVPAEVITAVLMTGDTLIKWGSGDITTQECMIQLGAKGVNITTTGCAMAVGQTLIPIPIIGAAVGALVGSILTSSYYNNLINDLRTKKLEHQERLQIISECNAVAEQTKAFRNELVAFLNSYFMEYRTCFDDALSKIQLSYQMSDADGVISGANEITLKLGGQVYYNSVDEFSTFLDNDSIDVF